MSNKNKNPVDAYSKEEFEAGLEVLEKSGVIYEPRSVERDKSERWQTAHAAATDEEKSVLAKLDQLYANAQRIANKENKKVTKKDLETMRGMLAALNIQAEERAQQIGTGEAERRARQIREVITELAQTTGERAGDFESIRSSIEIVREGLAWLERESPLAKNKYGKDGYTRAA